MCYLCYTVRLAEHVPMSISIPESFFAIRWQFLTKNSYRGLCFCPRDILDYLCHQNGRVVFNVCVVFLTGQD